MEFGPQGCDRGVITSFYALRMSSLCGDNNFRTDFFVTEFL